jgi:hypothetical protein
LPSPPQPISKEIIGNDLLVRKSIFISRGGSGSPSSLLFFFGLENDDEEEAAAERRRNFKWR